MSWWTTVAGLTPLAVHDAGNVSGTQLLDRIGTNHITATTDLTIVGDRLVLSAQGNSAAMSYGSAVTLPTNCTICALARDTSSSPGIVMLYDTVSGGYVFDHETSINTWNIAKAGGGATAFGAAAFSSSFQFLTVVKTGLDAVMYIDGVQLGGTLTDKLPPSINRIGFGSYTFQTTDNLAALGIWDGAATQAEVVSLEAACRAALAIEGTARGIAPIAPRLDNTVPAGVYPPKATIYTRQMDRLPLFQNLYAGAGQITGTVKKKALPDNLPLARKVRLYHDRTGQLVAETWSDAVTGVYQFLGLDLAEVYTALALDHTHTYRAVAADNLSASL
jgi:hypothetical protein